MIFETLDRQCSEKLGKGCLDLLEEARAELAEKRAMQPQPEPPAKKKQYDMDR